MTGNRHPLHGVSSCTRRRISSRPRILAQVATKVMAKSRWPWPVAQRHRLHGQNRYAQSVRRAAHDTLGLGPGSPGMNIVAVAAGGIRTAPRFSAFWQARRALGFAGARRHNAGRTARPVTAPARSRSLPDTGALKGLGRRALFVAVFNHGRCSQGPARTGSPSRRPPSARCRHKPARPDIEPGRAGELVAVEITAGTGLGYQFLIISPPPGFLALTGIRVGHGIVLRHRVRRIGVGLRLRHRLFGRCRVGRAMRVYDELIHLGSRKVGTRPYHERYAAVLTRKNGSSLRMARQPTGAKASWQRVGVPACARPRRAAPKRGNDWL